MAPSAKEKIPYLRNFHKKLYQKGWNLKGYGDVEAEIELLENFDKVIKVFGEMRPEYQEVVADIAKKMGNGMADFLVDDVVTLDDYDLYCHYVAGLVGEGLSRLFAASHLEDPSFSTAERLWKSMGLFLQKTNITRDYLEDVTAVHPRIFWPKDIWQNYVDDVTDMQYKKNRTAAVACLNHMVYNAFTHAEDCIDYLDKLTEPSVFTFCAIPQTMAFSTLALCYNNGKVFEKEVKIRKGEAVRLITSSSTMTDVLRHFYYYAKMIEKDIPPNDPNGDKFKELLKSLATKIVTHPEYRP
jgi:farnesyl-diphosphate farnesyltransferase